MKKLSYGYACFEIVCKSAVSFQALMLPFEKQWDFHFSNMVHWFYNWSWCNYKVKCNLWRHQTEEQIMSMIHKCKSGVGKVSILVGSIFNDIILSTKNNFRIFKSS